MTERLDAIRDDVETELSRLGSSKVVYALTDGEMDADEVLAVAADRATARAKTLDAWADDADGELAELFERAATVEREHGDRLVAKLDEHDPADSTPTDDALRDLEGDADRLGGLVGATLVGSKLASQFVGFFVGQADPKTPAIFREYGEALDERLDELVEAITEGDGDEGEVVEGATAVVQAAYEEEYVAPLEAMGVKPKPVC